MKTNQNSNFENGILSGLAKMHEQRDGQKNLVRLEYLYYTDLDLKGEALAEDLQKLNYEVEVDATGRKCDWTRVFGKTALLAHDDDDFKEWYLEMRDVGNYHECDFICYSVIKDPAVNIDTLLENRQVVNEEKFESGNQAQEEAAPVLLDIMRNMEDGLPEELVLEFFFYTNEKSKAEDLAEALGKFGYEVYVEEEDRLDLKYSITGQTIPLPGEDDVVLNWSKKMNELGYIHDCQFDGWGSAVQKGGWFSDDTPDDVLRKRLGLPPREE